MIQNTVDSDVLKQELLLMISLSTIVASLSEGANSLAREFNNGVLV